jgi:molybdopterin/thiamine biosynthesis adenylyltransferase
LPVRADEAQLRELVAQADVVLDCSDNFATRYAVNRVCLSCAPVRAQQSSSTGRFRLRFPPRR